MNKNGFYFFLMVLLLGVAVWLWCLMDFEETPPPKEPILGYIDQNQAEKIGAVFTKIFQLKNNNATLINQRQYTSNSDSIGEFSDEFSDEFFT